MNKYKILTYSTVGALVIIGLFGLLLRHDSISVKKIDHNKDGIYDEWQYFKFKKIIKKEYDVNNDGKVDSVVHYQNGIAVKHESDLNYDGEYDMTEYRRNGIVLHRESALENDGRINYWAFYENGEVLREETDLNYDGIVDRWVYYESGKALRQEIDEDFDGIPDNIIDLKEKREELFDNKMILELVPLRDSYEEDKDIEILFRLKNVTESDLILAKPELQMEYRAIKLFIKKANDESTFEEYVYGPRRYSVHEGYLLKADEVISQEWVFNLKTVGKIYDGYGDYKMYAEYAYEPEGEFSKKYWSGVVRSEEVLVTVNPNKKDLWMDEYRQGDLIVRSKLETSFKEFDAEDQKYILKNLLGSDDVSIQQFAVFELAHQKRYVAVDMLIKYLESPDENLRLKSITHLKELSGVSDDFDVDWKRDFIKVREAGIEKWKEWWVSHQPTLFTEEDKEYMQIIVDQMKSDSEDEIDDDFMDDDFIDDDIFDENLDEESL